MFTALRLVRKAIQFSGRRRAASTRPTRRTRLMLEELETRTVPSAVPLASPLSIASPAAYTAGTSTNSGFTPIQIQQAYGTSALLGDYTHGTDGQGETIAIVDAYSDPTITSDANTFSAAYGLPSFNSGGPTLTIAQPGGTPRTNAGWGTEMSLDVEWAHAIAPQANILLVEASSASTTALMTAVKYAASHANVVSMSWGSSEFSGQTAYDSVFASYPNVTFVASSGDTGARVEWPSSSPYVLAIGGTALIAPGGAYQSESAWADGGGGVSRFEGQPSYQNGFQSDKARTTPDVAYNADPNTGVAIYDSTNYQGYVGWYGVGGTSAGAPQWSAIVALSDQLRGGGSTNALNTAQVEITLYGLASNSTTYAADFHDVTTGSTGHAAGTGYDLATGLGTPQVNTLVPALAGSTASSTITVGSAPSRGGKSGSPGGIPSETAAASFLLETDTTAVVVAAPSSIGAPSSNAHVVVSAGTPSSNVSGVAPAWASSAWQSGGGGAAALATDLSPVDQAAPAGAAMAPEGVGAIPWLGEMFTEAVRQLKVPFTQPPSLSPAPPMNHNGSPAPMKEQSAPTPSGKGMGVIPLEKVGVYAFPAAVGLLSIGLEREERRRRERLLEKPR